jgi:mannosyl-oligosaccharide alpha-1,2-mannosidase
VESLDTLYVMGLDDELAQATRWVETSLELDIDADFQVFEAVIRMVGGLLAGHLATRSSIMLDRARELADRLLPAFTRSPTGMPYRFVNLHTGAVRTPANFVAEIGTNLVEFGALSKLVGDDRYLRVAKAAAKGVFDRRSALDLIGTTIDVETGAWLDHVSAGPQPPADSYYEYLQDGSRFLGDPDLALWFQTLSSAMQRLQWDESGGRGWYRRVQLETGTEVDTHESELAAFWAGNLAEAGMRKEAGELLDSFTAVLDRYGIFPEEFDYADLSIRDPAHQLRPEFADACLAMFIASGGDEAYRARAYRLYEAMKAYCRVPNGYTIVDDITTRPMTHGDLTPAYWFAENMKYFYLLFAASPRFDYANNYLSTEGKILAGLR